MIAINKIRPIPHENHGYCTFFQSRGKVTIRVFGIRFQNPVCFTFSESDLFLFKPDNSNRNIPDISVRINSNPDISVRIGFLEKVVSLEKQPLSVSKVLAIWRALYFGGLQMKKRRKSTIKNWSKIIVVCLAPFRDSGAKTTITGNFRVEWVSIISIMSIIS